VTIVYLKYSLPFVSLLNINSMVRIIKIQLCEYLYIAKPIKEFTN